MKTLLAVVAFLVVMGGCNTTRYEHFVLNGREVPLEMAREWAQESNKTPSHDGEMVGRATTQEELSALALPNVSARIVHVESERLSPEIIRDSFFALIIVRREAQTIRWTERGGYNYHNGNGYGNYQYQSCGRISGGAGLSVRSGLYDQHYRNRNRTFSWSYRNQDCKSR
jgi:hypothetical protein